jgi:outer membrane protein assembly factor BamD
MLRPASALLACLLVGSACAETQERPESPLQYAENAKRAYHEALEPYFDRDWEEASLMMSEVKRKYGYSRYARLAELRMADAAYHQEKYPEAVAAYKGFVHDFPNDPEVPYARYKIAKAQFEQTSPSLLLPPLEERDLAAVSDAYNTIRDFLGDYPGYKHRRELEYMFEVVTGLLVRHELYVARFYLAENNFDAAAARVKYALSNFTDSGLEAEALVLLGEIRLMLHQREQARALFRQVLAAHPASPFIVPARRFLKILSESAREQHVDAQPYNSHAP